MRTSGPIVYLWPTKRQAEMGWEQGWNPAQTLFPGAAASTWRRRCLCLIGTRCHRDWMHLTFGILWPESVCEDAREFEQDPDGDGKLMGDWKGRAVTQSDLCLKDHSDCILEGGFEDGKSQGKEISERRLIQVRNYKGLGEWWIWYLKGRIVDLMTGWLLGEAEGGD